MNMQEGSLKKLYVEELKDLYSAETQLLKALPKMAEAAESDELREGFEEHLRQTEEHVQRLENIFRGLDESPKGKKCVGMEGLIKEGKELMEEEDEGPQLDAGLISKAQHVEHYEIAGYGTVRNYAKLLGEDQAVELLEQTLEEEKETDQKLTELSEQINLEALESGKDEEESGQGRRKKTQPMRKSASA